MTALLADELVDVCALEVLVVLFQALGLVRFDVFFLKIAPTDRAVMLCHVSRWAPPVLILYGGCPEMFMADRTIGDYGVPRRTTRYRTRMVIVLCIVVALYLFYTEIVPIDITAIQSAWSSTCRGGSR